jgi:hypothetical protein
MRRVCVRPRGFLAFSVAPGSRVEQQCGDAGQVDEAKHSTMFPQLGGINVKPVKDMLSEHPNGAGDEC